MYIKLMFNQNIRYYLLGGGISKLGDVLSGMAFLFLAYEITESKVLTTGMAIAETLPYLLFGLIGGVISDWVQKKRMLIILDFIRIPLIGSIVLFYYADLLGYAYLLFVSFLIQSIGCFFNPAHRALLPLMTEEKERTSVNGLNDTLQRGVTVISPFLSIWILTTHGAVHFFTIDAITYGLSAFFLMKLQVKETIYNGKKSLSGVWRSIVSFTKWAGGNITLKHLFLSTFVIVFLNTWVWEVGLLLALSDMTSRSEEIYSLILGLFGAVVIVTNLVIPYIVKEMDLKTYMIGAFIWGAGVFYYGVLYELEHFFVGAILVGIGIPIAGLARVYLLQTIVPKEQLGRGFSTNAVLLYLANTLSLALFGAFAVLLPIQVIMVVSGMLMMLISIVYLIGTTTDLRRRFSIQLFK
ncbi:MFS transporter [Guptibacillus hwajinpoensis]|uniref:MFS transporter n=1 Tax=Guptibacillus hwajinpoensis TaxID=208199 RepID=UPI0024B340C2|nr:MFS transporter [Pseudalkalibacillus hwajinpoensis]